MIYDPQDECSPYWDEATPKQRVGIALAWITAAAISVGLVSLLFIG